MICSCDAGDIDLADCEHLPECAKEFDALYNDDGDWSNDDGE